MPHTLQYEDATRYTTVSGNGTFISRSGEGKLHRIVGNGGTGRLIVYDDTTAEPESVVTDITLASGDHVSLEYQLNLGTGLTLVGSSMSGAHFTVVYQ